MTLTEFLPWDAADLSGLPYQLIDGEPVVIAPGSETHAARQGKTGCPIDNHLIDKGSPYRLLSQTGVVARVHANRHVHIANFGVTCVAPTLGQMVLDPIMLIESLSSSNQAQAYANIWPYTTISSVQEILSVYSTRMEAKVLRRDSDGHWPDEPDALDAADTLTRQTIGYTACLATFYQALP